MGWFGWIRVAFLGKQFGGKIGKKRKQVSLHQNTPDNRKVYVGHRPPPGEENVPVRKYPSNTIITSKYTVWNFLPKNLFEQFRRVANFYFLCVAVIQLTIDSPVSPVTSLTPLVFVVTVTAVKQAYEDWRRHKADRMVNNSPVRVVKNGEIVTIKCHEVKVGDIVYVEAEEEFPCDLVLLSTSDADGRCHITTANLDGESNLKVHECLSSTKRLQTTESLSQLHASIECKDLSPDLYEFVGRMNIYHENGVIKTTSLGLVNTLFKGAALKNTPFIYGCAVYTGQETKMALNLRLTSNKFSTVERSMNRFLLVFLILLIIETTISTILKYCFIDDPSVGNPWYLPYQLTTSGGNIFRDFLSFVVILNYIIPISLYVTLEMVKFVGSLFLTWDADLYDELSHQGARCNSSDLNEELGQVEYLFADKTGTLTENDMRFRKCSIKGISYVEHDAKLCRVPTSIHNPPTPLKTYPPEVQHFLLALAVCNTVHVERRPPKPEEAKPSWDLEYQASSPDEKALVEACRRFGVVLYGVRDGYYQVSCGGKMLFFEKLHVLEFTSERKKMSVIIRNEDGNVYLFCKGAENAVLDRTISGPQEATLQHVNDFALEGLRTLVIAQKQLAKDDFDELNTALERARNSLAGRETKVSEIFDEIETDLEVLGATAVEDRLQEGVSETLGALRLAGIKIWVLTGDKIETAVNVSYSCGHFTRGTTLLYLVKLTTPSDCKLQLDALKERLSHEPHDNFSLVIDGHSLAMAIYNNRELFREICSVCTGVLCCRMSPIQKAEVVRMIKFSKKKPITAAVGDGANDVSMIQEAHVGLGIMGKEGRQAVRCSDFAFVKFRYLKKILLVHGHYYYVRVSTLVHFFFYKNVSFVTPQFLYMFYSAFSAQPLYHSVFLTFYNVLFTSFPILIYGLSEQDVPQPILLQYPQHYKEISRNARMTKLEFIKWILQGFYHALVLYCGFWFVWGDDVPLTSSGHILGMWGFGTAIFHTVVILSNLKLCLHTRYWTRIFAFAIVSTILSFILLIIGYSGVYWSFRDNDLYWIYIELLATPAFWVSSLFVLTASLVPDLIMCLIESHKLQVFHTAISMLSSCLKPRENLRLFFNKETGQVDVTMSQINILEKSL